MTFIATAMNVGQWLPGRGVERKLWREPGRPTDTCDSVAAQPVGERTCGRRALGPLSRQDCADDREQR